MAGRDRPRESGTPGHGVAARLGAVRRPRRRPAWRLRRPSPHQALPQARPDHR